MRLLLLGAVIAVTATAAGPAYGHEGGKAEPRIAAGVSATGGTERTLTVRLTDIDSGKPVPGATVVARAEMSERHLMRLAPWRLPESRPGLYRARVRFAMPARWVVAISASGKKVVSARASFTAKIERGRVAAPAPAGDADLAALPTRIEDDLSERDLLSMAVLWLHGVAALGWIVGVLVLVIALSARPAVLASGVRVRLQNAYRSWGAWLHWSLVPVIVLTGIYNMLAVTPFPLAWRPSDVRALTEIPFGALYEAILVVKLGLFAALLITGTQLLARTVRLGEPPEPSANPHPPGAVRTLANALGPSGVVYLAAVPLILAAAMALRYVHVLSHVAEVLRTG